MKMYISNMKFEKISLSGMFGQADFSILNHPLIDFKSVRFTIVDFAQESGYNYSKILT